MVETLQPKRFSWINAGVLISTPLIAVFGAVMYQLYFGFHYGLLVVFLFMYLLTGLSITAGYHRYFAHRAYDCHPVLQVFFLLFGAAALQNSALAWVSDHRYHHRHVDRPEDPYNINKGFWWAHIGWIFFEEQGSRSYSNVIDLKKNKWVMRQYKYYVPLAILIGLGVPFLMGLPFGCAGGAVLWGGVIRLVVVHHATFLINSAAHYFGKQTYSDQTSAKDNWLLAFFSFGEGYHNFHHSFPSDYRNGIAWYHWDPSKWMIHSLSFVGMTWQMKKTKKSLLDSFSYSKQGLAQHHK